ncbi:5442_t:CDS:2, partial [Cetraspora pellucida]
PTDFEEPKSPKGPKAPTNSGAPEEPEEPIDSEEPISPKGPEAPEPPKEPETLQKPKEKLCGEVYIPVNKPCGLNIPEGKPEGKPHDKPEIARTPDIHQNPYGSSIGGPHEIYYGSYQPTTPVAVVDVFKPGKIQFHFSFSDYGEKTIILGLFNLFHCKPKDLSVSAGEVNLNNLHNFTEALKNSQIVDYGYGSPAIRLTIHYPLDALVGKKFVVCCKRHVIASTTIEASTEVNP